MEKSSGAKARGKGLVEPSETSLKRKRGIFARDLRLMMYGFGDDPDPLTETVDLVEDILVEYVTDMIHRAQEVAKGRGKMSIDDLLFLLRKDNRKYARVKELLNMNEELKRARKAFVEEDLLKEAEEASKTVRDEEDD